MITPAIASSSTFSEPTSSRGADRAMAGTLFPRAQLPVVTGAPESIVTVSARGSRSAVEHVTGAVAFASLIRSKGSCMPRLLCQGQTCLAWLSHNV
jgi:hypothetical protein